MVKTLNNCVRILKIGYKPRKDSMQVKEQIIEGAVYYDDFGKETEDFENSLAYNTQKSNYVRELKAKLYVKGTIVRRDDLTRYKWRKVGPVCYMKDTVNF